MAIACSKQAYRMWEVNLHRNDLTIDERAEHWAEWLRLRASEGQDGISGQLDQKIWRGRPEGGLSLAVRKMPIKPSLLTFAYTQ